MMRDGRVHRCSVSLVVSMLLLGCRGGGEPRTDAPPGPAARTPAPSGLAVTPPVASGPVASRADAGATVAPVAAADAGPVFDAATAVWSPDRKLAVTLIESHAHVWDGASKAHLREIDASMTNEALFSPDGKTLYLAHENSPPSAVKDPGGRAERLSFELVKGIGAETDRGTGMHSLSADGALLLARCNTVEVCLYNTKTFSGRMWTQPKGGSDVSLTKLAFDPTGKRIIVANEAGATFELEVPSLRRLR